MTTQELTVDSSKLLSSLNARLHHTFPKFFEKYLPPRPQNQCGGRNSKTCVLNLIRSSPSGVHPTALVQMTGYNRQKLDKILHRLFRRGQIMVEFGGVYTGSKLPFSA